VTVAVGNAPRPPRPVAPLFFDFCAFQPRVFRGILGRRRLAAPPLHDQQSQFQLFHFPFVILGRETVSVTMENIHKSIGALVYTLFHRPSRFQVILDPECGGNRRIQLFSTQVKSRATNYCWPDIVITEYGIARLGLEIEQTGIVSPGRIGGKLVPTALSSHVQSGDLGRQPVPLSDAFSFIQIVNTALLPPGSRKQLQYQNLQASIRRLLPLGCVHRYFLVPVAADSAPLYDMAKYESILSTINDELPN